MVRSLPIRTDDVRPPALVLVTLVATVLVGELALARAIDGATSGPGAGFPFWLPTFGSLGRTVVYYAMFFDFVTFVLVPGTLIWLGYAFGRRRSPN